MKILIAKVQVPLGLLIALVSVSSARAHEPTEPWALAGKAASIAFSKKNYFDAELQLRKAIHALQRSNCRDERVLNLKLNLAEALLAQGKRSEAIELIQCCESQLKPWGFDLTPVHLRCERIKQQMNSAASSDYEKIMQSQAVLALSKRIFGTNAEIYKKSLLDLFCKTVNFNHYDESLKLLPEARSIFCKRSGPSRLLFYQAEIQLGQNLFWAVFKEPSRERQALTVFEGAALEAAQMRNSAPQMVIECYRYLAVCYKGTKQYDKSIIVANKLVKLAEEKGNPVSYGGAVGSAYLTIAQCYDTMDATKAESYYRKSIPKSLSDKKDFWAPAQARWATIGLTNSLIVQNKLSEALAVIRSERLDKSEQAFFNNCLCNCLLELSIRLSKENRNAEARLLLGKLKEFLSEVKLSGANQSDYESVQERVNVLVNKINS